MEKMIAKTLIGSEYVYDRNSAHAVAKSSAEIICKALNDIRHQLKDGEIWHVYDAGWYEQEWTAAGCQKFIRRNGGIAEVRMY